MHGRDRDKDFRHATGGGPTGASPNDKTLPIDTG